MFLKCYYLKKRQECTDASHRKTMYKRSNVLVKVKVSVFMCGRISGLCESDFMIR